MMFGWIAILVFGYSAAYAGNYFDTLKRNSKAACTEAKSVLSAFVPPFALSEGPGSVELQTLRGIEKRDGCKVALSGPYAASNQIQGDLNKHFDAAQWTSLLIYAADGASGGQYAVFKDGALCIVKHETNSGGLDGPPPTWYNLEVNCVGGHLVTIVE